VPKFTPTLALTATPAYTALERKAIQSERTNHVNGWGYIISGAAVMALSIPAFYATEDVFGKAIYSVGQNLGLGAVTYGASMVLLDDDYVRFHKIIKDTPNLTPENKEALSRAFFIESAERAKQSRHIRFIGHSLGAGLNFVNAATASNSDLRAALYFIGGINTLAAISFHFRESDEEKAAKEFIHDKPTTSIEPLIGPTFGVAIRW
jgi:hypothetical protein